MAQEQRRVTVSVPEDLADDLEALRQQRYSRYTRSDMLRDLLRRGLEGPEKDAGAPDRGGLPPPEDKTT